MSFLSRVLASSLFRKGGIYLFSSFLSQGVMLTTWLLLPWKLTAEEIGQFALLSFVIELLTRLTVMGTDSALLRFYVDPARRPQVLAAVSVLLAAGAAVATLALALTWNIVPAVLGGLAPVYHQLAVLGLLVAIVSAVANTTLAHYIASHEAGRFGWLSTLRSVLLAGGYLLGAWSGYGLHGLLLSQLVASLIVIGCFGFTRPWRVQTFRPERPDVRELFAYGSPMLVYGLFALISDYSSRLVLEGRVTLATIGIFQFYYQITTQINGVWASINRAWTPHVFKHLDTEPAVAYSRITLFSLWGTLGCAAGIIVVMLLGLAGLWSTVIPPLYAARIDLFYLLLLGPLFCAIYTAIYPAFYFEKDTVRISITQTMISLLTIGLTIFSTIRFKSEGAALSWVLSNFLTPFIYVCFFPKIRPRLIDSMWILLCWGVAAGSTVVALLQLHSTPAAIAALLLGATGATILGRRTLVGPLSPAA